MKNVKELLFDKDRGAIITLTDGAGREIRFEQVYVTEREGALYCILRPLALVKGLDMQTALLFAVDEAGNLHAVRDPALTEAVFSEYYEALLKVQGRD